MRTIRTISFSKKASHILEQTNPKNISDFVSRCVEGMGSSRKVKIAEFEKLKVDLIELQKEIAPEIKEIIIRTDGY